ncbi:MAG TPA: cupredoxin domain-containing protein [Rhodocyclaceae bacterium]
MRNLVFLALALLAAAAAAEDLQTFQVVARDGKLSPERLEVPAGTRFKLALHNDSRAPVEFENLDLRVEKVLAPGSTSFVVIRTLAPGSYKFVDEFHADTAQLLLIAK